MAEQKDDPIQASRLAQSKRATQSGGATEQLAPQDRNSAQERSPAQETSAAVVRRKQRYLIGIRALPGFAPLQADPFLERLSQMDGVEIVRKLQGRGSSAVAGTHAEEVTGESAAQIPQIIVARMDEQRGEALRRSAPPHVVVELDAPLSYSHPAVPELMSWQLVGRGMPFPRPRREIRVRVVGEADRPLANAVVNVYGPGFPAQAITDASGHANLQIDVLEGAGAQAIYVRPAAGYWERYLQNPSLDSGHVNLIRLTPLDRIAGQFPGERPYGWGQRVMQFDRLPTDWAGSGIKIGLIDSGCDSSHQQLNHVARGVDLTRNHDAQTWKSDELGHGTHCAGTIAAAAAPSAAIIGCAPGSEVHVFKVVPGGHLSDLIDALDLCIERRLDIVQIGVNADQFSELVAQKITVARLHGVACIVAAGNTGGAVQFPGNVPGVLTVAAVGKLGEYPQDTRHGQRALPQLIGVSGIYATNFSSWGPQIGLCAPGVAIVSSVPGGGYAAWDGSSMAAAHVAGMSALLLAHHPMLQSINYGARAEPRVSVLFELLRAAAIPYAQVDPNRVGAGLPDLQQVPGLSPTNESFVRQVLYATGVGLQPSLPLPPGYLANSMQMILQLRAAGLWV
jgi:subtilisin